MTDSALENDDYHGRKSSEQMGNRSLPPVKSQETLVKKASPRFRNPRRPETLERPDTNARLPRSAGPGSVRERQHSRHESEHTSEAKHMPHLKDLTGHIMDAAYLARLEATTERDTKRARKRREELSKHRELPDEIPHSTAHIGQNMEEEQEFQEWWDEQEAITKSWLEKQSHAPNPTAKFYSGEKSQHENPQELPTQVDPGIGNIDRRTFGASQRSRGPIHSDLQEITKVPPFKIRKEQVDATSPKEDRSNMQQRKTDRDGSKHVAFNLDLEQLKKESKPSHRRQSGATAKIAVTKAAKTASRAAVKAATSAVERLKPDVKDNNHNNKPTEGKVTTNSRYRPVHTLRKEQPLAPFKNDSFMGHGRPSFVAKVEGNTGPPVPPKVPISILKNEEVPTLPARPPKLPVGIMKDEEVLVPPVRPPKTPVGILEKEETPAPPKEPRRFSSHYEEWNDWVNISNE